MDNFLITLQILMWGFCIILIIKVWIMTNDVKDLKHFIDYEYKSTSKEIYKFHDWIDSYMRSKEREGSVVYGEKDHKKYIIVRVLSDGNLLLDDNPSKTNIVEMRSSQVIQKWSEVTLRGESGDYYVSEIRPDGMLNLYDEKLKKYKLSSIDEILFVRH